MTLSRSNPRATPRWLLLAAMVALCTLVAGSIALANHSGVAEAIPANFFTVEDEHLANDVPGQVDLTQMGRDDSNASLYQLFWSWDSISAWTGTGQTGDACALFDTDGDTNINHVVCARVSNPDADPAQVTILPKSATEAVYLFACSDKKNDRCTTPSPLSSSGITAGVLGTLDRAGNLVTHTDPFTAGESHPHDTTIQVNVPTSVIPGAEVLTNVCSYPSAGNGGNNNPFDCIVSPGGGFIVIVKDAGSGVTTPTFTFDVHRGSTLVAQRSVNGSATANEVPLLVGSSVAKVTETAIPAAWDLTNAECKLNNGAGTVTGSYSADDNWVSGITVESGKITKCTFTDRLQTGTLVVEKRVINDNGGTLEADDFSFSLDANLSSTAFITDPDRNPTDPLRGKNTLSLSAGTAFSVTEPAVTGYTASYDGCSGTITAGQTSTCLITNDDDEPRLTLLKTVTNDNGGTALASAWTLTATGTGSSPTNLSGDTPESSGVGFKADTYTLAESGGPGGYTAGSWSCAVTGSDPTVPVTVTNAQVQIGLGDDVTCTINNDDAAPSLTLVKTITNDNGGESAATAWTLTATGTGSNPTNLSGTTPEASGTDFRADTYTLGESGPAGYTAGAWSCRYDDPEAADEPDMPDADSVVVGQTDAITCTIHNDDDPATPQGSTVQSWVLHDTLTISGIRPGAEDADDATVTFYLFSDDECSIPVGSPAGEEVGITDGSASTADGFGVTDTGLYYWVAVYSGDANNTGFETDCGDEVSQIQAKDAAGTGRNDLILEPSMQPE